MKVADIPYVRPEYDKLGAKIDKIIAEITNAENASKVLAAREEYIALVKDFATMASLAFVRFTLNTKDEFYAGEREYYDEIMPKLEIKSIECSKAMLSSPFLPQLKEKLNPLVFKMYELSLKVVDEKILAEMQEENALTTEYSKFVSELLYDFEGEKITLTALKKHMVDNDRERRKAAYNALGETLEKNKDTIDNIFDKMVKIRDTMAKKMGYENYVDMGYDRMNRVAYDKELVKKFRENVKRDIVPLVSKLKNELSRELQIDSFKLYDNDTYLKKDPRPILDAEGILEAGRKMYNEMSPETSEFIEMMINSDAFDVLPREGKWTGGYCTEFENYNQPFIFANFNGTTADVDVVTHEAGHAFAFYTSKPYQVYELGVGGMETAETHSMSMEFLCWKYMDKFFGDRANDYCYKHLFEALTFIPYGVIVDYFQHIVYENPDMTAKERNEVWKKLEEEFRPYMDADGITYLEQGTRWQYQNHIFERPFYYIDYCLAQSVAIQFLLLSRKNYDEALNRYLEHAKRGGLYDFNTLVKKAGLNSPFEDGALKEVATSAEKLLKSLHKG